MESINTNPQTGCFYSFKETVSDITSRVVNFVVDIFRTLFCLQFIDKIFSASNNTLSFDLLAEQRREWVSKISTCSMEFVLPYIDGLIKEGIAPDTFDHIIFVFLRSNCSHKTFATDGPYARFIDIIEQSAPKKCLIVGITDKESVNGTTEGWKYTQTSLPEHSPKMNDCEYLWSEFGKNNISQFVEDFKALIQKVE